MADRLTALADKIRRAATEKRLLARQLDEADARKAEAAEQHESALMAKELVLQVAQKTQANVGGRVSDLVSLALAAVFDTPYRLQIDFVQRRGVTEADLWFARGDNLADPMTASGGGALDVASLALRLAIWSLSRTRPLFLLDEPFRNLSLNLQSKAGLMLKELANKLGLQVVMVSHNPEIISGADRVFRVLDDGRVEVQ